jgi:RNA polymerase sigma-70 factor, ECF subfamily
LLLVIPLVVLLTMPVSEPSTAVDERILLQQARRLDEQALSQIHTHYYPAIFRYLRFRVPDYATAEDLASEVFIRFLHAIRDKHAPPNSLRGWLLGTASHVLNDYYRANQRETPLTDELAEQLASGDGVDAWGESLTQHWVEAQLAEALRELTEEQQQVLALRFGYGLPLKEIASSMDKTEAAVKMLQARALSMLAKKVPQLSQLAQGV